MKRLTMNRCLTTCITLLAALALASDAFAQQRGSQRRAGQSNVQQFQRGNPNGQRAGTARPNRQGGLSGTTTGAAATLNLPRLWEEEKLARDVYVKLLQTSGLTVFRNISQSENQHMQAAARLMGAANLKDVPGNFSDPEFQKLFSTLVTTGSRSPVDALLVGAKIEEMDIADLQKLIAGTSDPQVQKVLGQLLKASGNHLRAYTSQLKMQGVTYTPQILSPQDYAAILSSPGNGQGQNGRGNAAQNGSQSRGRGRGQSGRRR